LAVIAGSSETLKDHTADKLLEALQEVQVDKVKSDKIGY